VQKVQEGSGLVNQSGKTLDEIVTAVKKVADIIAEISAASQEQASGIEQVNKAVMQMDQITQQNAALVEETAAASQSMTQQAGGLQGLVSQFRLDPAVTAAAQAEIDAQQSVATSRAPVTSTRSSRGAKTAPARVVPRRSFGVAAKREEGFEEF
jgi:methyl-accepting chemotaxis protein